MAKIKAVCIADKKGRKFEVPEILLQKDTGVSGDFHAKGGNRQVSLLASESIDKMREKGLKLDNGAFGENIITEGINLLSIKIGQILKLGKTEIKITIIGKKCVEHCSIYYQAGDCIMPREGIFAEIIKGGNIKSGDTIEVVTNA